MVLLLVFFPKLEGLDKRKSPLSLFMIAMKVLSCFLKKAVCCGLLSRYRVRGRSNVGVQSSHLLFVDDTLLFHEMSPE